MMTDLLRKDNHDVKSFVEESVNREGRDLEFDVEKWIESDDGIEKFKYDLSGAIESDILIYIAPSGCDAWAEVGAAFASKKIIFGLHAKGEPVGLARHMAYWYKDYRDIIDTISKYDNKYIDLLPNYLNFFENLDGQRNFIGRI